MADRHRLLQAQLQIFNQRIEVYVGIGHAVHQARLKQTGFSEEALLDGGGIASLEFNDARLARNNALLIALFLNGLL